MVHSHIKSGLLVSLTLQKMVSKGWPLVHLHEHNYEEWVLRNNGLKGGGGGLVFQSYTLT